MNPLLNRIEKSLNINIRRLATDWSWLFSSQMVGAAMAILLAYAYANFLTQETYGTYKYILAMVGTLSVFSLQGMEDAAQRAIAQHKDQVFWSTFTKRLRWSSISSLLTAVVGGYYYFQGDMILGPTFLAIAPLLLLFEPLTHFRTILMGRQEFKRASHYTIVIQIITSLTVAGAVLVTDNLLWLLVTYFCSFILVRGLAFWHVVRNTTLNNEDDPKALNYGKHMSVVGILGIVAGQLDSILLWHFLGPVQLAIYSFSLAVVAQLRRAIKTITSGMAFSKFSKSSKEAISKTLHRKVLFAHAVTIPCALVAALLVPLIYQGLFPQYLESIPYAQAMTLLLAFAPMRLYVTAIFAVGSTKTIYQINILSVVVQISFLTVFIALYGIWGIVIANILQLIVVNSYVLYVFKRL